jgi:glycosyltransferase involved in cell wall biosynthesis
MRKEIVIGIIVPAHNEEETIAGCVTSLLTASQAPALAGEAVEIIVVLDACRDRTGSVARALGVRTIEVRANNVGLARQAGAASALARGARWLAFTDADSVVGPQWLTSQLALGADAVCGTVSVEDWGTYGERMRRHFRLTYKDTNGHAHVHGANMGVSAQAYVAAGGFIGLQTGEDVALVEALKTCGARVEWSSAPRVITSVRKNFKAPGGFGAYLQEVEQLRQWVGVDVAAA